MTSLLKINLSLLTLLLGSALPSISSAQAQPRLSVPPPVTAEKTYHEAGWSARYCQRRNVQPWIEETCWQAARIAEGSALDECYSEGNPICSIKLVWVSAKEGSCLENTDRCAVDAVAVPYRVQRKQYVGDFKIK